VRLHREPIAPYADPASPELSERVAS
jgi:hypothetical protein